MTRRVVQLTDCHLFSDREQSLREIRTWPRLIAVLEHLRASVPHVDLLVITGDTAHDEAAATYAAFAEATAPWADRLRIVPGNHDDRTLIGQSFPQAPMAPSGRTVFQETIGSWQVIGLDSQETGQLWGQLGDDQLSWLADQLTANRDMPTLLFLHHPPLDVGSAWLDRIGLRDAPALATLVTSHPQVRLVACGHVHHEFAGSLPNATLFTTPAVGPAFRPRTEQLVIDDAPPGYRLFELSASGRWATQVLRASVR